MPHARRHTLMILRPLAGINVLDLGEEEGRDAGCVGTDPLRLTVSFEGGLGGYEADEMLIEGTKQRATRSWDKDKGVWFRDRSAVWPEGGLCVVCTTCSMRHS